VQLHHLIYRYILVNRVEQSMISFWDRIRLGRKIILYRYLNNFQYYFRGQCAKTAFISKTGLLILPSPSILIRKSKTIKL